ncbi:hypothetical protein C0Q70_13462 [Pomacea canaliculata]|uniref:Uncharacterized protein n=1 Tax=Pomacea canaliculata TaxID=400727 RepID=A0A2T7NXD0_POMCA|nr:hypothetical protein C0Q70_13462 [Pomacea canaliculata]
MWDGEANIFEWGGCPVCPSSSYATAPHAILHPPPPTHSPHTHPTPTPTQSSTPTKPTPHHPTSPQTRHPTNLSPPLDLLNPFVLLLIPLEYNGADQFILMVGRQLRQPTPFASLCSWCFVRCVPAITTFHPVLAWLSRYGSLRNNDKSDAQAYFNKSSKLNKSNKLPGSQKRVAKCDKEIRQVTFNRPEVIVARFTTGARGTSASDKDARAESVVT